jgi:hypothetical protein
MSIFVSLNVFTKDEINIEYMSDQDDFYGSISFQTSFKPWIETLKKLNWIDQYVGYQDYFEFFMKLMNQKQGSQADVVPKRNESTPVFLKRADQIYHEQYDSFLSQHPAFKTILMNLSMHVLPILHAFEPRYSDLSSDIQRIVDFYEQTGKVYEPQVLYEQIHQEYLHKDKRRVFKHFDADYQYNVQILPLFQRSTEASKTYISERNLGMKLLIHLLAHEPFTFDTDVQSPYKLIQPYLQHFELLWIEGKFSKVAQGYSSNSAAFNNQLRQQSFSADIQVEINELSSFIQSSPALPTDIIVYRGLSIFDPMLGKRVANFMNQYNPGDPICFVNFSSTSLLESVATNFIKGYADQGFETGCTRCCLFKMYIRKGSKVIFMTNLGRKEHEILLDKHAVFKYLKRERTVIGLQGEFSGVKGCTDEDIPYQYVYHLEFIGYKDRC